MPADNLSSKIKSWLVGLTAVLLLLLVNLFYLDWRVIDQEKVVANLPIERSVPDILAFPTPSDECPLACQKLISQVTPVTEFNQPPAIVTNAIQTGVKEYFIPLGSGSSRSDNWEDQIGIEAYVDKNQYHGIKSVVFEATMKIPNGNQGAYARLYNVTDKHPVWFSEVYLEGGEAKYLTSAPITLDEGRKLYRVQLKTTIKDLVNLNFSRLKITVY